MSAVFPDGALPVNENVKVIEYITIYKTEKWWQVVALVNQFGHDRLAIYLWLSKDGKWRRKHKFSASSMDNWEQIKQAGDKLAPKLTVMRRARE